VHFPRFMVFSRVFFWSAIFARSDRTVSPLSSPPRPPELAYYSVCCCCFFPAAHRRDFFFFPNSSPPSSFTPIPCGMDHQPNPRSDNPREVGHAPPFSCVLAGNLYFSSWPCLLLVPVQKWDTPFGNGLFEGGWVYFSGKRSPLVFFSVSEDLSPFFFFLQLGYGAAGDFPLPCC